MEFVSINDNLFEKETFESFFFPEAFSAFRASHKTLDVVIQILKNVKCFPVPFLLPASPSFFFVTIGTWTWYSTKGVGRDETTN